MSDGKYHRLTLSLSLILSHICVRPDKLTSERPAWGCGGSSWPRGRLGSCRGESRRGIDSQVAPSSVSLHTEQLAAAVGQRRQADKLSPPYLRFGFLCVGDVTPCEGTVPTSSTCAELPEQLSDSVRTSERWRRGRKDLRTSAGVGGWTACPSDPRGVCPCGLESLNCGMCLLGTCLDSEPMLGAWEGAQRGCFAPAGRVHEHLGWVGKCGPWARPPGPLLCRPLPPAPWWVSMTYNTGRTF